jgi:hypothetical protein
MVGGCMAALLAGGVEFLESRLARMCISTVGQVFRIA